MKLPDVSVYVPTQVLVGDMTIEKYISGSASALYDEWVCDRRWSVEDVCNLIIWEQQRRYEEIC